MSPMATRDDNLLIAEEIMLLLLPDNGKVGVELGYAHYPLTGALLAELAIRGHIDVRDDGKSTFVRAADDDSAPTPGDSLLGETLAALGNDERTVPTFVESTFPKVAEKVLDRLVERGILDREKTTSLLVIPTTKWSTKDPRPEEALRSTITDVLEGRSEPEERIGAIIALLTGAEVLGRLKPSLPWNKETKRRAREIQDGNWGSTAVAEAVQQVAASVNASLTAAIATTTSPSITLP